MATFKPAPDELLAVQVGETTPPLTTDGGPAAPVPVVVVFPADLLDAYRRGTRADP